MSARRCERATPRGWQAVPIEALVPGQVFRLFEPDGTPVIDEHGATRWRLRAVETTWLDAEGILETDVERAVLTEGMFWPAGPQDGWIEGIGRGLR